MAAETPTVELKGLSGDLAKNAHAFLSLSKLDCQAEDWRIQSAKEKAPREIAQGLQALGYYSPRITSGAFKRQGKCWSQSYEVEPGEPVHLAAVDVRLLGPGAQDPLLQKAIASPPLKTGASLNHGDYEATKSALLSLAMQYGYFDARLVDHRLMVKPSTRQAWVHLHLDTGQRYRFGKVSYQNRTLDQSLVQRYQNFAEDDYFDVTTLNTFQQALVGSQYFADVNLHQRRNSESKIVDLDLDLEERKRRNYGIGLGFTTDAGPHISAKYENRYLNTKGHRFETNGKVSGIGGQFSAAYSVPLSDPTKEWLTFSATAENEKTDTSDRTTYRLGGRMTTALRDNWLQTLSLDVEQEDFEVAHEKHSANPLVAGIGWQRTQKDNPMRIREGHQLKLELLGAPVDFADGATFAQAKASAFWITSFGESSRLLLRSDLGGTLTEDHNRLGVSHRFFAGGDRSIRGYDYQSLGPKNSKGKVIGGTSLIVGSIEFEQAVAKDWAIAAFVDSGNAFYDKLDTLYTGAGLGLRWFSPLGPVKVDVAQPLSTKDGLQLHVGIGPEF
jgi:translocation and assembly module TamA